MKRSPIPTRRPSTGDRAPASRRRAISPLPSSRAARTNPEGSSMMDRYSASRSKRSPAPNAPDISGSSGPIPRVVNPPAPASAPAVAASSGHGDRAIPIPRVVSPPAPASAPPAEEKKKKNPLCFPPSQYNANIFKMKQPFLKARKTPRTGEKFFRKMDDLVLEHAILEGFYDSTLKSDRLFSKTGAVSLKEMGNSPVHLSLLGGFADITKPREQTLYDHRVQVAAIRGVEVDYSSDEPVSSDEEDVPDMSNEDVLLCMGAEEGDGDEGEEEEEQSDDDSLVGVDEPNTPISKKSDDSILLEHEAGRTDITIKVFDLALKQWITVCVVENKEVLTSQVMYQALSYACRKGLVNAKLGQTDPIYVMVWAADVWKLGVLYISETIRVTDEQVICADVEHQQKLHQKLTRARKLVKDNFAGEFTMDGEYLSGSYYLSPLKCSLPVQQPLSEDALIFYELLMRIVIGEKVVNWSCRDVDEAIAVRRKMDKELKEAHRERSRKKRRLA